MTSASLDVATRATIRPPQGSSEVIRRAVGRDILTTGASRGSNSRTCATLAGWFASFLALEALLGWFLNDQPLKAIIPGSDPLKINIAAGFLLCGAALILLSRENCGNRLRATVAAIAIVVLLLGALTLSEYFLNRDLLFEGWGIKHLTVNPSASHPGRMMPTTAFCFVVVGLALFSETRFISPRFGSPLAAGLSAALVIIGVLAVGGFLLEIAFGPQWNLLGMSVSGVSAAIGFTLLGAGLLFLIQSRVELGWWLGGASSAAFVIAILLTVVTTAAAYTFAKKMLSTDKWVTHREEVLKEIQRCRTGVVELLDTERAYIILGDEELLNDRQQTTAGIKQTLATIRELTRDNPYQGQRLDRIEPALAERITWEEKVIVVRRAEGLAAASKMIVGGPGFRLSGEIRDRFGEMEAEEYRLLKADRKNSEAAAAGTFLLLPLGVFLSITTLSLAFFFLNRGLADEIRAQANLRDSEQRYRSLFQNNPNPMWVYDLETLSFLAVNDAAVLHYGFTQSEFLAMNIKDIRPPEDVPALMEDLSRTEDSNGANQWRHRKKNGLIIDVEITSHELIWRERRAKLVLITDITERKRAENERRISLKEVLDLKSALDDAAIVAFTDQRGKITYVNDKFCQISKYSKEELIGQDHRIINSGYHSKEFMRNLWTTISRGGVWHGEIRNKAKDGSFYWVDTTIVPFLDDQNKPRQYVAIRSDITERKHAEAEIQKLNAELEERVEQRTAALEVANKELEAFSYSVSHDLRAPLRAVDGFSQAVVEDYASQLPETARRYLKTIREGAQRMGTLIDDLLTFSRLSRLPLEKQRVNSTSLVGDALNELRSQQSGRQIDIRVGDLPKCEADPRLLKQVWINLLSNAIKYTGRREQAVIEVGFKSDNGTNAYFVSDNGTGFDMQYAHKLFGVFQRLHRTDEFEGTGVGLAIVQRVIHRHGGRIWAQAEPDRGATFFFTLGTGETS